MPEQQYLIAGAHGRIGSKFASYCADNFHKVKPLGREIRSWSQALGSGQENIIVVFSRADNLISTLLYYWAILRFCNQHNVSVIFLGSSVQFLANSYISGNPASSDSFDPYSVEKKLTLRLIRWWSRRSSFSIRYLCPPIISDCQPWKDFFDRLGRAKSFEAPLLDGICCEVESTELFDAIVTPKGFNAQSLVELVLPVKKVSWRDKIMQVNPEIELRELPKGRLARSPIKSAVAKIYFFTPLGLPLSLLSKRKTKEAQSRDMKSHHIKTSLAEAFEIEKSNSALDCK